MLIHQKERRPAKQAAFTKAPKHHFHRRVFALIDGHDLERNRDFIQMRAQGSSAYLTKGRHKRYFSQSRSAALYIRKEVKDTARAAAKALLHYADHTFNANYLFEVKISTIELAKVCNQYQDKTEDKRMSYEPMRRMLNNFVALGYLVEATSWNAGVKTRAATRYFITPAFFEAFGLSAKDAGRFVKKRYESMPTHKRQQEMDNYHEWQTRIKQQKNIAQIRSRYLATKLKALRAEFISSDDDTENETKKAPTNDQAEVKLHECIGSLMNELLNTELFDIAQMIKNQRMPSKTDPPEKRRYELSQIIILLKELLKKNA